MTDKATQNTDTSRPFLVLLGPSPDERIYDLRLVNPTSSTLTNVCTDTGGFFSDDSVGVVNATGNQHQFGDIPPGGSVTVERPDDDELYEFVIWWTVTYGNPLTTLDFALRKNNDGVPISAVPVVGGKGILIPISRRN